MSSNILFEEAEKEILHLNELQEAGSLIDYEEVLTLARVMTHPVLLQDKDKHIQLMNSFHDLEKRLCPTNGKRHYTGILTNGKNTICTVKYAYDHIFVMRKYGRHNSPQFRLSWRFEINGLLDLVDVYNINTQSTQNIINALHIPFVSNASRRASVYSIPETVRTGLNATFIHLPSETQYEHLVRYGHSLARDVNAAIIAHTTKTTSLHEGQRPLSALVLDKPAKDILQKAAHYVPLVRTNTTTAHAVEIYYLK